MAQIVIDLSNDDSEIIDEQNDAYDESVYEDTLRESKRQYSTGPIARNSRVIWIKVKSIKYTSMIPYRLCESLSLLMDSVRKQLESEDRLYDALEFELRIPTTSIVIQNNEKRTFEEMEIMEDTLFIVVSCQTE